MDWRRWIFFRAKDSKALALWYQQHLGILTISTSDGDRVAARGRSNRFHSLPGDHQNFGDPQEGLDAELSRPRILGKSRPSSAAEIAVKVDPESYPYGRFARLHDPEGRSDRFGNLRNQSRRIRLLTRPELSTHKRRADQPSAPPL